MRTKAELRLLALDIATGKVFTSWMIPEHEQAMPFLMLMLMGTEHTARMKEKEITHIYEYYDKACERSVNGMPMFFSHHELSKAECAALFPLLRQARKQQAILAMGFWGFHWEALVHHVTRLFGGGKRETANQ